MHIKNKSMYVCYSKIVILTQTKNRSNHVRRVIMLLTHTKNTSGYIEPIENYNIIIYKRNNRNRQYHNNQYHQLAIIHIISSPNPLVIWENTILPDRWQCIPQHPVSRSDRHLLTDGQKLNLTISKIQNAINISNHNPRE